MQPLPLLALADPGAPKGDALIQGVPVSDSACGVRGAGGPVLDWARAVLEAGALGWVFFGAAVVASAAVSAFIVRSFTGAVDARLFLAQVRKLVQAGNAQRAVRLAHASEAPVVRLARAGLVAGLEPAKPSDREDAGYRDAAAEDTDPVVRARAAMDALMPGLRTEALRGVLIGRVASAAACASGAALTPTVEGHSVLHSALLGALALGALYTVFLQRKLERDLSFTHETVVALCNEPAIRG